MSDLTRSGTVEQESMEGCELAAVLDDYRAWIDGQGFSPGSATDHIVKLTHLWPFLTRRGLLTGNRVHWHHIDRDVIAEYQAHTRMAEERNASGTVTKQYYPGITWDRCGNFSAARGPSSLG